MHHHIATDAISIGYVCGDTIDKAYRAHSEGKGAKAAAKMGFDVLLWQSLASVAVPGLTINVVVRNPLLIVWLARAGRVTPPPVSDTCRDKKVAVFFLYGLVLTSLERQQE